MSETPDLGDFLAGLRTNVARRTTSTPATPRGVGVTSDGGGLSAGISDTAVLREALQRVPDDLRPEIRKRLRIAAAPIVADAKRRAAWSDRIPGAISTRVQFSGKKTGVRINVSARRAPHARPYEGLMARARDGRRSGFSHPVFAKGGRGNWTWMRTEFRPFLAPAVEAGTPGVERSLLTAVDEVLRRNGF